MKPALFYLALGLLFTHEMDAMPNHEWRGLPVLSAAPDELGMQVFLLAHVPIFAILIAFVASLNRRIRKGTRTVLSAFFVVHGFLHFGASSRPSYEFSSTTSNALIYGAALFGLLYLALLVLERTQRSENTT